MQNINHKKCFSITLTSLKKNVIFRLRRRRFTHPTRFQRASLSRGFFIRCLIYEPILE